MSEFLNKASAVAATAATLASLAIMNTGRQSHEAVANSPASKDRPHQIVCSAIKLSEWGVLPSNIDFESLAAKIGGVTAEQLMGAKFGPVKCENTVTTQATRATVRPISRNCTVFADRIGANATPDSQNVVAICASDASPKLPSNLVA